MKIGIFDSGLGGLIVLRQLKKQLPRYEYLYLGDTKNMPYGEKTQAQIYTLTRKAVAYLFSQNCTVVIVACNTASSQALRKLQQEWLPTSKYSDRKILGIIRPTAESVPKTGKIGIIGTRRTIDSKAYTNEFLNTGHKIQLIMKAAPKLASMIEEGRVERKQLAKYLQPLQKAHISTLVLACTHYGEIKQDITRIMGKKVKIICQEEILPAKLKIYLTNHPEIKRVLNKINKQELQVTKKTLRYSKLAHEWFKGINLKEVRY